MFVLFGWFGFRPAEKRLHTLHHIQVICAPPRCVVATIVTQPDVGLINHRSTFYTMELNEYKSSTQPKLAWHLHVHASLHEVEAYIHTATMCLLCT